MLKRGIALILISVFFVTTLCTGALANTTVNKPMFTDVPLNHWAREFVERVAQENIMGGFNDNTFKPADNMSKISALVAISRMIGFNEEKPLVIEAMAKYGNNVENAKIPAWAKECIAYSIQKGLINDEDLTGLLDSKGQQENAKKQDVIVYIAKALGLEDQAQGRTGILPYNDSIFISRDARPYVYVLIEKGVLDPKGDQNGNINAHNLITRAEVAKMISVSLGIIEEEKKSSKDEQKQPIEEPKVEQGVKKENVIGVMVEQVITVGTRMVIEVADDNGRRNLYDVSLNAKVLIDNKEASLNAIKIGQRADIVLNNSIVESINLISVEEEISGKILNSYNYQGMFVLSIETVVNQKPSTRVMEVSKSAPIILNGKTSTFDKLEKGDIIKVGVVNKIITRVEGYSKILHIQGIFEEFKIQENVSMAVVNEKGETETYFVQKNSKVYKDNKASFFEEMRKGNIINAVAEYDASKGYHVVAMIEAQSVKRRVEGYISEIIISKNPTISVEKSNGQVETFKISRDGRVWLDSKMCDIYDLRLNYSVSMQIESDEAVEIVATKREKEEVLTGVIKHVNTKARIITVAVEKDNKDAEYIQVFIDYTASISLKGTTPLTINQLKDGSTIMMTGKKELGIFTANMILVLVMGN